MSFPIQFKRIFRGVRNGFDGAFGFIDEKVQERGKVSYEGPDETVGDSVKAECSDEAPESSGESHKRKAFEDSKLQEHFDL